MKVGKHTIVYHPKKSVILDCQIGDYCIIHAPVWIGNNVKIGDGCKIQAFSFIPDGVTIKNNVFVGPGVIFTNDKYPPSNRKHWTKTLVKKGAVVGAGSIIVAGITIGERSKIGAGSVVTKDIPDDEVWFGNPAKKNENNCHW